MRHSISLALIAITIASLICSCKPTPKPHSDYPFTIDVSKVRTDGVCADVIPENNDFGYLFIAMPKEAVDAFAGKEEELIASLDKSFKDIYVTVTEDKDLKDFEQKALYNGAYFEYIYDLTPGTDYYIIAYAYSGIIADKTLTKVKFSTPELIKSNITFAPELDGATIKITPSNADTYLCEFWSKDEVDTKYGGPFKFHETMSRYYWEENFFPNVLDSGYVQYDLNDYFDKLSAGDQFYLTLSGYNNGVNTDVSAYLLTYNGSDKGGTVTPVTAE